MLPSVVLSLLLQLATPPGPPPGLVSEAADLVTLPAEFPRYGFARTDAFNMQAGVLTADVGVADGTDTGAWARVEIGNEAFAPVRAVVHFGSSRGSSETSVERALTIAARGRAAFVVWLPSGLRSGQVVLSGPSGELDTHGFYVSGAASQVLAVGTEASFTRAAGQEPVDATQSPTFLVTTLPAELLPDQLMSYSAMAVVFLGETRLEQLSADQRRALEAYVAVGGRLVLGSCGPLTLARLPLLRALPDGIQIPYGFGEVFGCGVQGPALMKFFARSIITALPEVGLPFSGSYLGPYPATWPGAQGFALLPEAAPPVGAFYAIVVAFALLVGPGSVWVVRRRGPLWLLATLPGAALVTSLVMVGSALAGNGLQTLSSFRAVTLLAGGEGGQPGRAISVGMGAFFSGRASPPVTVPSTAAWYPKEASLSVDAAYSLGGLIPPRVYRELSMAQVSATRARLLLRSGSPGLTLQNALGGEIVQVRFREGGRLYEAGAIRDGGEAAARPLGAKAGALPPEPWPLPALLFDVALKDLADGDFVALTAGTQFLPLPIEGMRLSDRRTQQWVRGRLQR